MIAIVFSPTQPTKFIVTVIACHVIATIAFPYSHSTFRASLNILANSKHKKRPIVTLDASAHVTVPVVRTLPAESISTVGASELRLPTTSDYPTLATIPRAETSFVIELHQSGLFKFLELRDHLIIAYTEYFLLLDLS